MAKSRDPMVDLLKAIERATKENTAELKKIAKEEKAAGKEFQAQQKELFQRAQAYSQTGFGGIGRGMAGVGGAASGLHGLGFTGTSAGLSRAAGPIGMALGGVNAAAGVARVMHDPFATGSQNARSLARMAPGGETLMNWADSFGGRAAGMEVAKYRGQLGLADVQARGELSAFKLSHNPQQAGYMATAAAYQRGSATTAGVFDRSTTGGRTAAEDAQRMLPYRQATAKAEREMAAATAQRVAAQKELSRLEMAENKLIKERVAIERQLNEGGSGVERQKQHEALANKLAEQEAINHQVRQAKQSAVAASRGEATSRGEYSKAQIRENLLGRADIAESRAGAAQQTAHILGNMDPLSRQQAFDVMKMIKDGADVDLVPPQLKALAQQAFPQEYAAAVEEKGRGSSVMRQATAAGFKGAGDYVALGREADTLREQAGREEYAVDTKVAGQIAKAGADLGAFIAAEVDRFTSAAKSKILEEFRKLRQ